MRSILGPGLFGNSQIQTWLTKILALGQPGLDLLDSGSFAAFVWLYMAKRVQVPNI